MAEIACLTAATSAALSGSFRRVDYSRYPAANRPLSERAAPTASSTSRLEPLNAHAADAPDVDPSADIMRQFHVARDDDQETSIDTYSGLDPPSYSRYEPIMEKGSQVEPSTAGSPPSAKLAAPSDPFSKSTTTLRSSSELKRGLQIPSRISHITWGFHLPPVLAKAGVEKAQWRLFTREVKNHAAMSKAQWCTVLATGFACGIVVDLVCFPFGIVVAGVVHHKKKKQSEHQNFGIAHSTGALEMLAKRWNKNFFEPLGLQVRIEPPDLASFESMEKMDVASTKLFKYQCKKGYSSPTAGEDSGQGDLKEIKYLAKEGRQRLKALRKGRIILLPFKAETTQTIVRPMQIERAWTMENTADHADQVGSASLPALPESGSSGF